MTQSNGRLALGRLGALVEQLEALVRSGKEMILVTSGACGVGRQRLRYTHLLHSSVKDLHEGKLLEIDGKAAAAAGQSGLMALYDMLFSQLDLVPAQMLVTDEDFKARAAPARREDREAGAKYARSRPKSRPSSRHIAFGPARRAPTSDRS